MKKKKSSLKKHEEYYIHIPKKYFTWLLFLWAPISSGILVLLIAVDSIFKLGFAFLLVVLSPIWMWSKEARKVFKLGELLKDFKLFKHWWK